MTASLFLKSAHPLSVSADAVVFGMSGGDSPKLYADGLTAAESRKLASEFRRLGATGAAEEITRIPGPGEQILVAVGVGTGTPSTEMLRRAAGAATRALAGTNKVALALPAPDGEAVGALLEGASLGAYAFSKHLGLTKGKKPVTSITLLVDRPTAAGYKAALTRAKSVAAAVNTARDWINTSPLHLPPAQLAAKAKSWLADSGVRVQVLDEKALAKDGYGGILAVGQGSSRPPRLIRMDYKPARSKAHIAFVGKGITFDTGGISLKPPAAMHEMKADMSGAAAVITAIKAIAELGLPVHVTAYAACAENMPGGGAQRPGDVITTLSGRTVEVLNTDAEGRLVLADALERAAADKPDVILDIATLTGAAVIALGFRTAGVVGTDKARAAVKAAADEAGEAFWEMPMPSELRPALDSLVADIANISVPQGGMLTGGAFLADFVPNEMQWAHLDIAGPAFNAQAPYGYTHKGGAGFGVRTLVSFAERAARGEMHLR